jgi:hypothetical protein
MNEAKEMYQRLKKAGKLVKNACLACSEGRYCIITQEEAEKGNFEIICV